MREHCVTPIGTGSPSWEYSRSVSIGAPESYARASYHAVHTFMVTAPDGVRRPVRFSWQPVAGVRNTEPNEPCRATNICSRSLKTACGGGRPDSC